MTANGSVVVEPGSKARGREEICSLLLVFPVVELVGLGIARIQEVGCQADCLETTSFCPLWWERHLLKLQLCFANVG
jgi:hypothetical protein